MFPDDIVNRYETVSRHFQAVMVPIHQSYLILKKKHVPFFCWLVWMLSCVAMLNEPGMAAEQKTSGENQWWRTDQRSRLSTLPAIRLRWDTLHARWLMAWLALFSLMHVEGSWYTHGIFWNFCREPVRFFDVHISWRRTLNAKTNRLMRNPIFKYTVDKLDCCNLDFGVGCYRCTEKFITGCVEKK